MPSNGSLGTHQRGTTARLWKSLRLTFGRTLLKLLSLPKGPLRRLRRRTKPPPKRMKGRSSLLRRSHAVLPLTSKRSWMCSDAHRLVYPRNTVLLSIFTKPTSKKPTSRKLTSEEPTSTGPTSKKPSSTEPTSEKPTSKKPSSTEPTSEERT